MPVDPEKENLLFENGFIYISAAFCYVSKSRRKAFTRMYVDDRDRDSLLLDIIDTHEAPAWKIFYCPQQRCSLENLLNTLGPPLPPVS